MLENFMSAAEKISRPLSEVFDTSRYDDVVTGVLSRKLQTNLDTIGQYLLIADRLF